MCLPLAACTGDPSPQQQELELARSQFADSMPTSYSFQWRRSCECSTDWTQPVKITVTAGAITDARFVETNQPVPAALLADLETIEGVFGLIDAAIAKGAHSVDVQYDSELGFPRSVAVDYELTIADEELSLQLSDVRPLAE